MGYGALAAIREPRLNRRSELFAVALGWLVLASAAAFATTAAPAATRAAKVRFRFEGKTGSVVTEGLFCGAMRIERLEGTGPRPLTLAIGPQCVCECAPLPSPRMLRAIDVAASPVLEWDGRQGEEREQPVDCASRFPAARTSQTERKLAFRDAPPGRYRATFRIVSNFPPGCSRSGSAIVCSPLPAGRTPDGRFELCSGDRTTTVEFVLPAHGQAEVVVRPDRGPATR
jgi:hypothetical protein